MKTGSIEYAPDYKSKKKGVMISPHTGGASADLREVVDSEIDFKKTFDEAIERARLESAVVKAAKVWRREQQIIGKQLGVAVDALLQFEQEHGK